MAKVDVKLGASLLSVYDGNAEGLDNFIDSVTFFTEYVNSENSTAVPATQELAKKMTCNFIKTRLTGNARQIIQGLESVPDIVDALKKQCASKTTSDNIQAKLKSFREKISLETFCNVFDQTCTLLQNLYIKESIPLPKAKQMAVKAGVETLINGLKNQETKLILKAGTFTNLGDAIQKVLENSSENTDNRIFYTTNSGRTRNQSNNNNYYNRSHPNRRDFNNSNYRNVHQHFTQNSPQRRRNFNNRNNQAETNYNNNNNNRNFRHHTNPNHSQQNWRRQSNNSEHRNNQRRQNDILYTECLPAEANNHQQPGEEHFLAETQRQSSR